MKLPVPPNWVPPNLWRPSWEQTRTACRQVALSPIALSAEVFEQVITRLRESHSNGGAHLAAFHVAPDEVFDWFASRNRLLEDSVLTSILSRPEVRHALPDLLIDPEPEDSADIPKTGFSADAKGFTFENPFLVDSHLAFALYNGGAYWEAKGDGSSEKQLALSFCREVFGLRYSDIAYYISYDAWTKWFSSIAWDWTAIIFDKREHNLWVLAITDTD